MSNIIKNQTTVTKHTMGMFIIGAVVWVVYLVYVNVITYTTNISHLIPEITGIPLSWVLNYYLNTKLNFDMPFSIRRFISFCTISLVGWGLYILTTIITSDVYHLATFVGTILGVFTKTIYNVILQQAITFGKYGTKGKDSKYKSSSPNYDWEGYYNGNIIQKYWKKKIATHILSMVENNPIIDVGCGSSPILSMIKMSDKLGVDINRDKIEYIKSKDSSSKYLCVDGIKMPVKDGCYSTVICSEVIEHIDRPNELMRELARILKDDGVLVIATPDYSSIVWNIIEVIYGLFMRTGYELEHGSKFTKTGIVSLANAYGLEIDEYYRIAKSDMIIKLRKCQKVKCADGTS